MQRKLAVKIFTVNQFKDMFENVFSKNISSFTGLLETKQGQIVDLHDYFHRYFMDSFAKIAFSTELRSLTSDIPIPFAQAFDRIQRVLFSRFMNPIFKFTELLDPTIKRDIDILRGFAMGIIKQRKASLHVKNDLLEMFIRMEEVDGKLSDEALCDQVLNFLFAGRDSTYL
jgi:cytochrome P450